MISEQDATTLLLWFTGLLWFFLFILFEYMSRLLSRRQIRKTPLGQSFIWFKAALGFYFLVFSAAVFNGLSTGYGWYQDGPTYRWLLLIALAGMGVIVAMSAMRVVKHLLRLESESIGNASVA